MHPPRRPLFYALLVVTLALAAVHHTDAGCEWAYDRQSHIGRLDKARARGWTIVNMRQDWQTIFPLAAGR